MLKKLIIVLLFITILCNVKAQNNGSTSLTTRIDSLQNAVKLAANDSVKIATMIDLCRAYSDADSFNLQLETAKKANELAVKYKYKLFIGRSLYYIGSSYHRREVFTSALDNYFKALAIAEEINNKPLLVRLYNQIGIIYSNQKNHTQALKYFMLFAGVAETMNDSVILARCYNNVGIEYKNLKKTDIAYDYSFRALSIFLALKDSNAIGSCYNNIGNLLQLDQQYESAIDHQRKALEIHKRKGSNHGVVISNINISDSYISLNKFSEALACLNIALSLTDTASDKLMLRDIYLGFYQTHEKMNNKLLAFDYYKKYVGLKDLLLNNDVIQQQQDAENSYKFLNKEKEIDLLKKNEEISNLELSRGKTQRYLLLLGGLLALVLAYLFYVRFRQNQKRNKLLQKHNELITAQKKEILDSIHYAKRIQQSLLPTEIYIERSINRLKINKK